MIDLYDLRSEIDPLILLCGDFNINSKEIDSFMAERLLTKNPNFKSIFPRLKKEYKYLVKVLEGED